MFWNDDKDKQPAFDIPDNVVDLAYRIGCPTIPLDHAHSLSSALLKILPWLADEETAGVHLIHGAASGNGWFRPEDTENELLHLSRRTKMRLRVPKNRLQDAQALSGQTLDIEGHPLEIGKSEVFILSSLPTLFSRYVITRAELDETQFLEDVARELKSMDIPCRKILGGITHTMNFPDGQLFTRSLMVADLEPEQSVRLQQIGLGEGRTVGCGLFLPHKGIKPVKEPDGE
ncbi:MAG: type I-MYXAN CRISPR-associated protein Cas6/Cmx6 [Gammaproteobacteria bacterium]|nr:type I-MYXAN CRISPR-associated protein Cas6/Cmx6 [Gammaproteobacteria bacterium]